MLKPIGPTLFVKPSMFIADERERRRVSLKNGWNSTG
jgi:hypothetical protein